MRFYKIKEHDEVIFSNNEIKSDLEEIEASYDEDNSHQIKLKELGNLVNITVNDGLHSMNETHYIKFVVVETNFGFKVRNLNVGDKIALDFVLLRNEELKNIYLYCNVHSLIKFK